MSEAKASNQDMFNFNVCSQCARSFPRSAVRGARHAVPCGHVFCKDCVDKVEAEQKSGQPVCRRPGCERELGSVSEFPISWVAQRVDRIGAKHSETFGDQGNVGDRPPLEPQPCSECDPDPDTGKLHLATHVCKSCGDGVYYCSDVALVHPRMKASRGHVVVAMTSPEAVTEPAWSLCAEHSLPFRVADAFDQRPLCVECLAAARGNVTLQSLEDALAALDTDNAAPSAEATTQLGKLAEASFTAKEFRDGVAKWAGEATAQIKAWEAREVKHVQAVAAELVQLVLTACDRRIEVGASFFTQRMGLRASLEELGQAVFDLPKDSASRLSKKRAVYMERNQLSALLASSKIAGWQHQALEGRRLRGHADWKRSELLPRRQPGHDWPQASCRR